MKNSIALKMLKSTLWLVMVFGAVTCNKDSDFLDANNQLSREVIATQDAFKSETGKQTPSPIILSGTGTAEQWDNNQGVLKTALWVPPATYSSPANYPTYVPSNYDVMAHFQYYSSVVVENAVVEFTFQNIQYFVPHIVGNVPTDRTYSVNYVGNKTVITCTANLVTGWNPMFCFILKIDCNGNNNTAFWTDMKVNGVSVKGTIQNKVFDCNKVTTAHTGSYDIAFPLWCGDEIVDNISGTLNYHCVMQFENDVLLFMNMTYYGFFTGETGEVFRFKEITTFDLSKGDENFNFHFNAIGDKGSHFIVSGKYLNEDPWIAIEKAKCRE
ncbi:MAG: hypothetical protein Q8K04_08910 [Lutibacter sp.]|nr:hypothetical protein [Lutibacter sp.]